jgi:t-SNARE complex subunit (syntaxin)
MVDTTDIEKKSLEAHVELCAERYRFLEEKLETVESTLTAVKSDVSKVKDMVSSITEKRNNQIIGWGIGIIAFLAAMVGYLITHFVFK